MGDNTEELDAAKAARNAEAQAERDRLNNEAQEERDRLNNDAQAARETADAEALAARNKLETDAEKAKQAEVTGMCYRTRDKHLICFNQEGLNVLYSFVDPDRDGPLLPTADHRGNSNEELLGKDYECKNREKKPKVCWENRADVVKAFDKGAWEAFKPTKTPNNMIIYTSTNKLNQDEINSIDETKYGGICYTRNSNNICFNLCIPFIIFFKCKMNMSWISNIIYFIRLRTI